MIKQILGVLLLSTAIYGCTNSNKPTDATNKETSAATSNVMTDVTGTYEGTTPCADCEGIAVTLTLNKDQTYNLSNKYLGQAGSKPFEGKGKWNLDEATKIVTLEGITDGPSKFMSEAGNLIQLDMEGQKIEGESAKLYILAKKK
jgi:uncharacterized lipoprotein NlpE involved in copper resistance